MANQSEAGGVGWPTTTRARRLGVPVVAAVLILSAPARAELMTELNSDGSVTVYNKSSCPVGELVIPDAINGRKVTALRDRAFELCTDLTRVTIPDTVTIIGHRAFLGCTGLTSVRIGSRVARIGERAFAWCARLTSVVIPDGVTGIEDAAFAGCTSMTSVIIPESVTYIGGRAFSGCTDLTALTIPDGVTRIADSAFSGCTGLTTLAIPDSVTSIGDEAFSDCRSLAGVNIGHSVTSIGYRAFWGCTGLTSVTIPDSVTRIGSGAFSGCAGLTGVTIGNGVASIGVGAFEGCTSLSSVTIPTSVTSIDGGAFSRCTRLTSISVAPLNPAYGSLEGVLMSKDLRTIVGYPDGKAARYKVPEGVTHIGHYAFSECTSLTSITISPSVSSVGESAFSGCTNLTSITIPDSVTSMGRYAFLGCTSLANVWLGNALSEIANGVFRSCLSLTSITIPAGVRQIDLMGSGGASGGDSPFHDCPNLTTVFFEATPPRLLRRLGPSLVGPFPERTTVYHLPGAPGWGSEFGGHQTAHWVRPKPTILDFGDRFGPTTNGFNFVISWATNVPVVVEASADIAASWTPISTNTLTDGWVQFTDPEWQSQPGRFYRVRRE